VLLSAHRRLSSTERLGRRFVFKAQAVLERTDRKTLGRSQEGTSLRLRKLLEPCLTIVCPRDNHHNVADTKIT